MIKLIAFQLKKRVPIISVLLILSCLLSTIPQFFLPDLYSDITCQAATFKSYYLFTLSSFTHTPNMLITHFIGNLLVFLCFGVLTEIIIGSKRFAFITVVTFFSTTIVNYLHTTGKYVGHGASGIAWGYHIFFMLILVVLYEHKKKVLFKDIYIILLIGLMLFDIIGIPIFEVVVLKRGFFDNFGQTLHLVSMFVVVPFIFIWRRDIERNVKQFMLQEKIHYPTSLKSISIVILIILLALNAVGTFKVAAVSTEASGIISYEVIPESGADITAIPQKIVITFDVEIENSRRTAHSIYYNENTEPVQISDTWIDSKTLEIVFNRKFEQNERMKLKYKVSGDLKDDILLTNEVILEYQ